MIQGLFGDVLANSPLAQGQSVDWSKQPGVMANVGWDKLKPFQVASQEFIGSPYTPQQAQAKLESTPTTDTRSEYQKWLESMEGSGAGGGSRAEPGNAPLQGTASEQYNMANAAGYNIGFDPSSSLKGMSLFGPLGLAAGINVSQDPLGKFAYEQLKAQEAREALAGPMGGLSSMAATSGPMPTPGSLQEAAMVESMNQANWGGGGGGGIGSYRSESGGAGDSTPAGGGISGYGGGTY